MSKKLFFAMVAAVSAVFGQVFAEDVKITLLAVNDIHGNLLPSNFSYPDPNDRTKRITVKAGGLEAMSTLVKEVQTENPNTLLVGAGDLIGASPLVSSLLADEPTLTALGQMGMSFSSVGNHEFDKGYKELLRMQNGGCEDPFDAAKACQLDEYQGNNFQYLAANVVVRDTGETAFPGYVIEEVGGVKVGFIGLVLKETPTIVLPSGVAGLDFTDEAEAANNLIPQLKEEGAQVIIVMIHQGGVAKDPFYAKGCGTLSGQIVDITKKLDPAVDMVISGHTHQGYQCLVDGRVVTQSDFYGHLVMQIDIHFDTETNKVISVDTNPLIVDTEKYSKDPAITEIIQKSIDITGPVASKPIAKIAADQITRDLAPSGESALGDLIADAQLAATAPEEEGGAQIAFMNPGGIRANLPPTPNQTVNYGDIFTVQPFGNSMVVMTLTGADIKATLEQQFDNPAVGQNRVLQVSKGFSYTWDAKAPIGSKVSNIMLNGVAIDPEASYRVAVNNFLADGGDNFIALRNGTNRTGGHQDIDALVDFLQAAEESGVPVEVPARDRITVIGL